MKTTKRLTILFLFCMTILLTAFTCQSSVFSYEEGCYGEENHPNIYFINQSNQTVWLEWNPRYPMERTDSLFSGFQVRVQDTLNLMPLKSICWEGELRKIPFVRLFLFDAPYNSACNNPDSLRSFQAKHLIYMHWYTLDELKESNWRIFHP